MKAKAMLNAILLSSTLTLSAQAGVQIVGGQKVTDLNEVSFMVSLSGVCGGSVISSKWVLTAAHCAGYFSEVKGAVLNLRESGEKIRVKRVVKHPEYNRSTSSNDFALVELESEIDFDSSKLQAIKLADSAFADEGGQDAGTDSTVFGFGNLGSGQSNYTKDLNKVIVPIVSYEEANRAEAYNGEVDETMLPAGFAEGGKDSCQGDSGGPLVVYNNRNEAVQVGVVSWGEGCAGANKYGVYSKVSHAFSWIKKTISK